MKTFTQVIKDVHGMHVLKFYITWTNYFFLLKQSPTMTDWKTKSTFYTFEKTISHFQRIFFTPTMQKQKVPSFLLHKLQSRETNNFKIVNSTPKEKHL